jgi:tyrosyl-tRNA synthetase
VGDPSGKSKTRPQLTREQVQENAETYKNQVFKVLDPQKTQVRFNSEWLGKMDAFDFVRLAAHANVARMLERDDFNKRYKGGQPISVHEFLYPLLQAWDSVVLKADVEMGGTDQKFNLLLGRELMKDNGIEPQVCLTMPLLEGLDGVQKMSKSLNNYVGVDDKPNEMYGKLMSVPDDKLHKYYTLLSARSISDIEAIFTRMNAGEVNPKVVKSDFASEIVERFHSKEAAEGAIQHFESVFSKKQIPDEIPEYSHPVQDGKIWLPELLKSLGFVKSSSEGKRMVGQGAVRIDGEQAKEETISVGAGDQFVLQCGKRKFSKIIVG